MRMPPGILDLKRRNRIASIIEAKPGEIWPLPTPHSDNFLKRNPALGSSPGQQTNLTLVDFNLASYQPYPSFKARESGTRLSLLRPPSSLLDNDIINEEGSFSLTEQQTFLPFDTSEEDIEVIAGLYSGETSDLPSLPANFVFSFLQLHGALPHRTSLPLTWGSLTLKFTSLFNEITLALYHQYQWQYFLLGHELVVLASRLLTLVPRCPPDGQALLPRASEIVDVVSRLLVELLEAGGPWPASKDSFGDSQYQELSTSTCLVTIRDYLQAAQFRSFPYNYKISTKQPYFPLLLELNRMVSLTDYKYLLRLHFSADRIFETNSNVIKSLSSYLISPVIQTNSSSSLPHTSCEIQHSTFLFDLLDSVQYHLTAIGHFLSLLSWVLTVPSETSQIRSFLRQIQSTIYRLLEWTKITLHILTPTAIQRITQFGHNRICLDLAPWTEGVLLSQNCLQFMTSLLTNSQFQSDLSLYILPPFQILQSRSHARVSNSSWSVASVHKALSETCPIRKLRNDVDITLTHLRKPPKVPGYHSSSLTLPTMNYKIDPTFTEKCRTDPGPGPGSGTVFYHLDGSGRVKLGTWHGLVEHLVPQDRVVCSSFLRVFFLTFRTFATPHQLFYALVRHFEERPSSELLPVNVRITNALISWLELYFFEEDFQVAPLIQEFATNQIIPIMPKVGRRIVDATLSILENQFLEANPMSSPLGRSTLKYQCLSLSDSDSQFHSHRSNASRTSPASSTSTLLTFSRMQSLRLTSYSKFDSVGNPLLEWGPTVLASTLILIDAELFCKIRPQHIISYVTAKSNANANANTKHRTSFPLEALLNQKVCPVKRLVDWSNQVNHWVVETILWENLLSQRVAILKAFIHMVETLVHLNNFNMAMSILSGLNTSAITRLHSTWQNLPVKSRVLMDQYNLLFDPHRNFSAYRARLKLVPSDTPCIPFFGITLTDITFLLQGNPTFRTFKQTLSLIDLIPWEPFPEPLYINFDKFYRLVQVLDGLEVRQSNSYVFPNLDHPHMAIHSLREHIFDLPSASPRSFSSLSGPLLSDSVPSLVSSPDSSPSTCYHDIILSGYDDPLEAHSPFSSISTNSNLSRLSPINFSPLSVTYTLTLEDYFQKSLRLEPRPSPANIFTN